MIKTLLKQSFMLVAVMLTVIIANAQPPKNGGWKPDLNKLTEKRFNLIAHELSLDSKTEAKLRPIYMEYCQKMGELFKPHMPTKRPQDKTDEDIEKDIKMYFSHSRKLLDIRETYYNKFRRYLTPKQIVQVYDIERKEMQKIQEARRQHHQWKRK